MQEQINQLNSEIELMKNQIKAMQTGTDVIFAGNLDDILVERVINANISGSPSNNVLLRSITGATVLNYPSRLMFFKWKGQRLALPVYEVSGLKQ